jgi:hypothetical protein
MESLLEDFYINLEETRNKVESYKKNEGELQSAQVIDCHISLDTIYRIILCLQDAAPLDNDHVYVSMADNCKLKASELCTAVMNLMTHTENANATIDDGLECQQAIAQIMEITIRLSLECIFTNPMDTHNDNNNDNNANALQDATRNFAQRYSEYQRILLRNRSKPSIAVLANIRKVAALQSISVVDYIESSLEHEQTHEEHDHLQSQGHDVEKRPHANAITVILGEASSLIHPLILWKDGISNALNHLRQQDESHINDTRDSSRINALETNVQSTLLEMCQLTITTLHKEAQSLSKTVGEWFLTDTAHIETPLDSNLDEMVFTCQVLHRYDEFTAPLPDDNSVLSQHLAEQILQYTTNETKLISTNVERAIELAQPVQIIMGTDRYVPSVVEDAYYISQRSLDRAGVTMSSRTISMLANWVVEVWSIDGRVYNALMEQKGCCVVHDVVQDNSKGKEKVSKSPKSFNLFKGKDGGKGAKAPGPAPHSGTRSLDVHRVQIDTQFCLLNGIHAASSACTSLSDLFDSLLPEDAEDELEGGTFESPPASQTPSNNSAARTNISKEASMITLAKEQLQSHCNSYKILLSEQISQFLQEWIGTVTSTKNPPPLIASLPHAPSMHRLFYQISKQRYNLNATTLQQAESDENIKELVNPFAESRLMIELRNGKCDDSVTLTLIQVMSHEVAVLFLSTLIHQKQKQFSELGYLLLSKQIRTLEEFFCSGVIHQNGVESGGNTSVILREFQKLAQTVKMLECGNPMEWTTYESDVGDTEFDLSKDEIRRVMGLRIDWSDEAIDTVCKK